MIETTKKENEKRERKNKRRKRGERITEKIVSTQFFFKSPTPEASHATAE